MNASCMQRAAEGAQSHGWWQAVQQWASEHSALLTWTFVGSLASLVLCAALLPVVVCRLPVDYFATHRVVPPRPATWLHRIQVVVRNAFGTLFLLAGLAMLVLPGQGLLTILIGLLLLDFPGKRALERRIVARPGIHRLLDRIREKRGRAPFVVD